MLLFQRNGKQLMKAIHCKYFTLKKKKELARSLVSGDYIEAVVSEGMTLIMLSYLMPGGIKCHLSIK